MTSVSPESAQPAGGPGFTRFVARGNHRLGYESSGPADGTPVLALHDLLADRRQFRDLARTLREEGFRIMLPDARGHGASAMISGGVYPAREAGADALAVLDAEGVASAHVVAVGWGAAAAIALAVSAPERIRSLILAEPLLPESDSTADVAARETSQPRDHVVRAAGLAAKGQTEQALDLYLGMRFGADWRNTLPKPRLATMRRAVGSLGPLLSGLAQDDIDRKAMSRIERPVTLLLSASVTAETRARNEHLTSLLPEARVEIVALPAPLATSLDVWTDAFAAVLRGSSPRRDS